MHRAQVAQCASCALRANTRTPQAQVLALYATLVCSGAQLPRIHAYASLLSGSYASRTGSQNCTFCAQGTSSSTFGATSCSVCSSGIHTSCCLSNLTQFTQEPSPQVKARARVRFVSLDSTRRLLAVLAAVSVIQVKLSIHKHSVSHTAP
jgi:hypothetical protein